MRYRISALVSSAALLFASAWTSFAQVTATGTLQGTITDSSGAVVPNAEVSATDAATGSQRVEHSNGSGVYVFSLLQAGHYEVQVKVAGFATSIHKNVDVFVDRTTTIDSQMEPNIQSEVIAVESGSVPLVDVDKTDISRPVTNTEVENLPLNSRDFVALAILAPGARPVTSYDPTKSRYGVFSVDGSSGRNVNMTVNGVDNKDNSVGGPVMQLPLESIQEFNISTQRFSAANGRSEGAAINVITKSGTNEFHGSIFFQDRDQVFDALNYFEQKGARGYRKQGSVQQTAIRRFGWRPREKEQGVLVLCH